MSARCTDVTIQIASNGQYHPCVAESPRAMEQPCAKAGISRDRPASAAKGKVVIWCQAFLAISKFKACILKRCQL